MRVQSLAIGVDYKLFNHLNPTKLKLFFEAYDMNYKNRMKENETFAYINGIYVQRAIASCLPKGGKYPDKPIQFFDFDKKQDHELTEEEKKIGRENLVASLKLMQANFNLNKK